MVIVYNWIEWLNNRPWCANLLVAKTFCTLFTAIKILFVSALTVLQFQVPSPTVVQECTWRDVYLVILWIAVSVEWAIGHSTSRWSADEYPKQINLTTTDGILEKDHNKILWFSCLLIDFPWIFYGPLSSLVWHLRSLSGELTKWGNLYDFSIVHAAL